MNPIIVCLIMSCIVHFTLLHCPVWQFKAPIQPVIIQDIEDIVFEESSMVLPIEIIPNTLTVNIGEITLADKQLAEALLRLVEQGDGNSLEKKHRQLSALLPEGVSRTQWAIKGYLHQVREEIEKKKLAQNIVQRLGLVGNVTIGFRVAANGQFSQLRVLSSSGDASLDQSAIAAIQAASGLIKRPQTSGYQTIKTKVVIKYQYGL